MAEVSEPGFVYSAAAQAEDGVTAGSVVAVAVAQLGTMAASRTATMTIAR